MQTVYKKYITTSIIIWAGSFLLFMLVYFFVLSPQKDALNAAKQKLAQRDRDFKRVDDAESGVMKARLDKDIARLHLKVDNFVSVGDDSSKLFVDIGKIASELNITGMSLKGNQNEQSRGTLPTCKVLAADYRYVNFKGSFGQFARFINALERHKPFIFVDKFSIARSSQSNFSENDVSVTLAVFVCPEDGANLNTLLAGP